MAALVRSIRLSGRPAERVKRAEITFIKGVNLLVGPNGSGKTTILKILSGQWRHLAEGEVVIDFEKGKFFHRDFEKDNPRTQSSISDGSAMFQIASLFVSHGQANRAQIQHITGKEAAGTLILIDEPEQALDLEGIEELVKALKESPANQIIVASNHPFLVAEPSFHAVELVPGWRDKVAADTIAFAERLKKPKSKARTK